MKVVILAGGLGTRIGEETAIKPKPMIDIGERPILWHIMKIYAHYGFNEFIICCGYKGYQIKEYFKNYFLHESDVTFDFDGGEKKLIHSHTAEPWKVTLVDTGLDTQTGGRLKRVRKYLGDEDFMFTYGDGVGDINIKELLDFHKSHKKLATVTAVRPLGRFGALSIKDYNVKKFQEKTEGNNSWINGGFFVMNPKVIDYIEGDETPLETKPVRKLAKEGELMAYKHTGFWQPMDTLREKNMLENLWKSGNPPWKVWEK
ncbi:MAG: glucose-1-phosphate cytidylyltransferase [Candidatus Margulisiibacteriota bacterium]|nr:glucose-1-phosphate cytidylyltransferase [Candidatus Margulisiibacteriota bacterium]